MFNVKYNNPGINLVYAITLLIVLYYIFGFSFGDSLDLAYYCYAVSLSNTLFLIIKGVLKDHFCVKLVILPLILPPAFMFIYFTLPSIRESVAANGIFTYIAVTIFALIPTLFEHIERRKSNN
jgi:hypothetical protein